MPLDQSGKSQLSMVGFTSVEPLEQLPVRKVADRPQLIKGAKLPGRQPLPHDSHVPLYLSSSRSSSHFLTIRQTAASEVQTFCPN
jgi:hypothetical protein